MGSKLRFSGEGKMENKEFEKKIKVIDEAYDKWLDINDNLCEISIKEATGNAFFDGWFCAERRMTDEALLANVNLELAEKLKEAEKRTVKWHDFEKELPPKSGTYLISAEQKRGNEIKTITECADWNNTCEYFELDFIYETKITHWADMPLRTEN